MVVFLLSILGICCLGSAFSVLWIRYVKSKFKTASVCCPDNGEIVAKDIIQARGFYDKCNIELDDNDDREELNYFSAQANLIVLAPDVFYENTVWSTAVAAHEASHAVQYNLNMNLGIMMGYGFYKISSILFIVCIACGMIALISWSTFFIILALTLLALVFISQLVTYAIERNASNMAIEFLERTGKYSYTEISQIHHVLNAASFTYFAELFMTVLIIFICIGSLKEE